MDLFTYCPIHLFTSSMSSFSRQISSPLCKNVTNCNNLIPKPLLFFQYVELRIYRLKRVFNRMLSERRFNYGNVKFSFIRLCILLSTYRYSKPLRKETLVGKS